jgi:hypothetical protein
MATIADLSCSVKVEHPVIENAGFLVETLVITESSAVADDDSGGAGAQDFRVVWPHAYGGGAFAQAAMMGLLAGVRARQDADRSVGNVAGILVAPQ